MRRFLSDHGHVLLAAVLAAVFSSRGITALPLSADEFYSLHAVTEGLGQHTWEAPLLPYYAILWAWTGGGSITDDAWLRLLSLSAVVVTAMLSAATAARLRDRTAGYLAAVLLPLVASMQQYAWIAQPYALRTAGVAAALYCFFVALSAPARWRWWVLYYVSTLFAAAVMPQSLALVAVPAIYLASLRQPWAIWRRWLLCMAGLLPVGFGALVLMAGGSYSGMHDWLGSPALDQIPQSLLRIGDASVAPTVATAGFGFGLVVLGLLSRKGTALVAGAFGSAVVVWVVSVVGTSFWLAGTFLPIVPTVVVAAAVSLATLERRVIVAVTVAMAVVAIPAFTSVRLPRSGEADMRLAASIVEGNAAQTTTLHGYPTDAYGLGPALRRYGTSGTNWTETLQPTETFWGLYGDFDCDLIQSWDVGGNASLRLCGVAAQ